MIMNNDILESISFEELESSEEILDEELLLFYSSSNAVKKISKKNVFKYINNGLKNKIYFFDTIYQMKIYGKFQAGDMVITKGYYDVGDGGNGSYDIVRDDSLIDDAGSIHSVANNLKAKLIPNNDTINIKLFGAVENSNYINNSNIENALYYANKNRINSILIPSGTFLVDPTLPIFVPKNFTLKGSGFKSILKADVYRYTENTQNQYDGCKNTILTCSDIHNSNNVLEEKNIIICDLTIDGGVESEIDLNWSNNSNYWNNGYGICMCYAGNITIRNCIVKNTLGTGIYLDRNYNSLIDGCHILNCANFNKSKGSKNGISITGVSDNKYKANTVTKCIIENNHDTGIQFAYAPIIISDNHILNNGYAAIEGDPSYILQTEDGYGDCIIDSNYIYNNGKKAITIGNVNCQKIIVNSNIIKKHLCGGIDIAQYSKSDAIVSNNIIYELDNSTLNELEKSAIYVKASSVNISNNIIDNILNINGIIQTESYICQILNNTIINAYGNYAFNLRGSNIIAKNNNVESLNNLSDTKNIGKIFNIYGTIPENINIENIFVNGGYREFIKINSIPMGSIKTLRICNNNISNCTQGDYANLISIDNESNLSIDYLLIKSNYYNKDNTNLKMYKFIYATESVSINNYFNGDNFFNPILTNEQEKIVFKNLPTNIKEGNNTW